MAKSSKSQPFLEEQHSYSRASGRHDANRNSAASSQRGSSYCDQTIDNFAVQRHVDYEESLNHRVFKERSEQGEPAPFEQIVKNNILRQKTVGSTCGKRRTRQSRGSSLSSNGMGGVALSSRSKQMPNIASTSVNPHAADAHQKSSLEMNSERVVTPIIQVRLEQMWEENQNQMKAADFSQLPPEHNLASFKSVQPPDAKEAQNQTYDPVLSDRPPVSYHSRPFHKADSDLDIKDGQIEPKETALSKKYQTFNRQSMQPRMDQMTSKDSLNDHLYYKSSQLFSENGMKESPSPIADDEQSAACTNMTQDFKIKMSRVASGAGTLEKTTDPDADTRRQTEVILRHNLMELASREAVSALLFNQIYV